LAHLKESHTMNTLPVSLVLRNDLAWVTIDNPPVNATSAAVRQGLAAAVTEVSKSPARAAILRCVGPTFVAGGDITEFDASPVPPDLPDVITAIENCAVPWIAALHGSVFGGGLEIALGCAWRVAVSGTRFALPEVNLGIVPGAGGTQRLPRLVGVELALDMATSGRPVTTEVFYAAGGLDAVLPVLDDPTLTAFANDLGPPPDPIRIRPVAMQDKAWWTRKSREVQVNAKGEVAPIENLQMVKLATQTEFEVGQQQERARHLALRVSDQSRALRHVFFAQRKAARSPVLAGLKPPRLSRVAVIGNGNLAERLKSELSAHGLLTGSEDDTQIQPDLYILDQTKSSSFTKLDKDSPVVSAWDMDAETQTSPQDSANLPAIALGFSSSSASTVVEIMTSDHAEPSAAATSLAIVRRLGYIPVFTRRSDTFISVSLRNALHQHFTNLSLLGDTAPRLTDAWAVFKGVGKPFGSANTMPEFSDNSIEDNPQLRGLLAVMVNAGALAIEDQYVESPAHLDVIAVANCDFPRWRGGPMYYANAVGITTISEWMAEVIKDWPDTWRLSNLLTLGSD
jgi:enoyl-CoA hydratase/carnithine racemase